MKAFAELFTIIDQTTSINEKIDTLADYFLKADEADAIWCVALLTGNRPKRAVRSGEMRDWCAEVSGMPRWLLEESYHVVGDLGETITLLIPETQQHVSYKLHELMDALIALQNEDETTRKHFVTTKWKELTKQELFIFNKLIGGSFRVGVSAKVIIKALAKAFNMGENVVAHSLSGHWDPAEITLHQLLHEKNIAEDISKPYPFYLAYALEQALSELDDVNDWIIERKYDGIRGQLIVRQGNLFVWSRGEDLLTDKFIEFHPLKNLLPDGTVIDGEVVPVNDGKILSFNVMQTRIGRKKLSPKILKEAPLKMICYDLLELNGADIRNEPLEERRKKLIVLLESLNGKSDVLLLSENLSGDDWKAIAAQREQARELGCEGLMLKRKNSIYKTGRKKGDWWKWKVDPLSVDGVLIYAQRGHGRRANLYTDFTFAVWDGDTLVPFTKAYSGLTDKELLEVDNWIKRNTLDKFGPVRSVTPKLVFEIAFEGIQKSSRHKSGVALRFPRIARWRQDKDVKEANRKEDLLQLLDAVG